MRAVNEIQGVYQISNDISRQELKWLRDNPKVTSIQFSTQLSTKIIHRLEKIIFKNRPDIFLRVYGFYGEVCDLFFLEYIPSLRKVSADCLQNATGIEVVTKLKDLEILGVGIFDLDNFDFLDSINPNLKELYLHQTKSGKPRIDSIRRFQNLEFLYLEKQQKGIESISQLKNLKKILLRSISTPNLDYLIGLNELWSVDIKLGGIKCFNALETLPKLKYLEIWQVRGLSDLSFLSKLKSLQNLFLQSLPQVTELPNLHNLNELRRVRFESMKGLDDFSFISRTQSVQDFILLDASNLEPTNIESLMINSKIEKFSCWFGSDKKNNQFADLLTKHNKSKYEYSEFQYI
jgi:hypothetical protein